METAYVEQGMESSEPPAPLSEPPSEDDGEGWYLCNAATVGLVGLL
jgi:hypothetical protein